MRAQIGDVCHPSAIRCRHFELPVQRVVHDDRGPTAITARLLLVANLRLNARKASQPRNALLRHGLAHLDQIVMDLAISIDLAAVGPSLLGQCSLACILPCSPAQRLLDPGIKTARMDAEYFAENADGMPLTVRIDEGVPHFASLAKNWGAFLRNSHVSLRGQLL